MRDIYIMYMKQKQNSNIKIKNFMIEFSGGKKRKLMSNEISQDDTEHWLTFKIKTFLVLIDKLNKELRKCITAFKQV